MRLLFTIDTQDYDKNGSVFVRNSARSIILREGCVAMVYSKKYRYYKFPGGGIEPGETPEEALIRETLEETGLAVLPDSIREYGYVHRVQKGKKEAVFVQDNFYYFCKAAPYILRQRLESYEAQEGFTLEFVPPQTAVAANRKMDHAEKDRVMIERESRVLELLAAEGICAAGDQEKTR